MLRPTECGSAVALCANIGVLRREVARIPSTRAAPSPVVAGRVARARGG